MPFMPARFAHDSTAHALPDEHYNIPGSAASGGPCRFNKPFWFGPFCGVGKACAIFVTICRHHYRSFVGRRAVLRLNCGLPRLRPPRRFHRRPRWARDDQCRGVDTGPPRFLAEERTWWRQAGANRWSGRPWPHPVLPRGKRVGEGPT